MSNNICRRKFIKLSGSVFGASLLCGSSTVLLQGCAPKESVSQEPLVPVWPYPYVKLDPDKAAERAYNAFKESG